MDHLDVGVEQQLDADEVQQTETHRLLLSIPQHNHHLLHISNHHHPLLYEK
jgi:hypothetical protein